MNRPLYFERSMRDLAAASTDFAVDPGFIFANAAACARATVSCIRRCSSDPFPTTTVRVMSEQYMWYAAPKSMTIMSPGSIFLDPAVYCGCVPVGPEPTILV